MQDRCRGTEVRFDGNGTKQGGWRLAGGWVAQDGQVSDGFLALAGEQRQQELQSWVLQESRSGSRGAEAWDRAGGGV